MNNRFYTTVEESKHLLELGLSADTADMVYQEYETVKGDDYAYEYKLQPFYDEFVDGIPCWSFTALKSLIPSSLDIKWFSGFNETFRGYVLYHPTNSNIFKTEYELIVWLLENNYIKKG